MHESKVEEHIPMQINVYEYVKMCQILSFNPNNYIPKPLNTYFMNVLEHVVYIFVRIYKVCTIIIGYVMERNNFIRFCPKTIMAFRQ